MVAMSLFGGALWEMESDAEFGTDMTEHPPPLRSSPRGFFLSWLLGWVFVFSGCWAWKSWTMWGSRTIVLPVNQVLELSLSARWVEDGFDSPSILRVSGIVIGGTRSTNGLWIAGLRHDTWKEGESRQFLGSLWCHCDVIDAWENLGRSNVSVWKFSAPLLKADTQDVLFCVDQQTFLLLWATSSACSLHLNHLLTAGVSMGLTFHGNRGGW